MMDMNVFMTILMCIALLLAIVWFIVQIVIGIADRRRYKKYKEIKLKLVKGGDL